MLFSLLFIAGHQCCPGVWHVCCYETRTKETQTARNWQCVFQHCPWSFWPFGFIALFKYPWLQTGLLFLQWCRGTRGCEYSVLQMVTIMYLSCWTEFLFPLNGISSGIPLILIFTGLRNSSSFTWKMKKMNCKSLKIYCLEQLNYFCITFFWNYLFLVYQGSDIGSAVYSQSTWISHDSWSSCGGINGFCFTASRRVSHFWEEWCLRDIPWEIRVFYIIFWEKEEEVVRIK